MTQKEDNAPVRGSPTRIQSAVDGAQDALSEKWPGFVLTYHANRTLRTLYCQVSGKGKTQHVDLGFEGLTAGTLINRVTATAEGMMREALQEEDRANPMSTIMEMKEQYG